MPTITKKELEDYRKMCYDTEPFSEIEIPELFDNELAPILQLVAMFTNSLNVAA